MARKYNNDEISKALKANDGLISLAAKELGCSNQTIYRRAKKYKYIQQIIDDSRDGLIDLAEHKLRAAIKKGEPWSIGLTLKTIGKRRGYVEKTEIDTTQDVRIIIERKDLKGKPADIDT